MKKLMASILVAMSFVAHSDTLDKHLEGKALVYVGVCHFDKLNVLTFDNSKKVTTHQCSVGMALPDQSKHYVMLYTNGKPSKLVMYDEKTKQQVTLWIKGGA